MEMLSVDVQLKILQFICLQALLKTVNVNLET